VSGPTPPEYADEHALLSVDPPTESRPTIRFRAAGTGVGAVVELSAVGASRLAAMLNSAVVTATARGIGGQP
jgi:hypothetical protein